MHVAGHVLWPRAAWLYHGTTFLVTLSFLVSGGLTTSSCGKNMPQEATGGSVSKLNNSY